MSWHRYFWRNLRPGDILWQHNGPQLLVARHSVKRNPKYDFQKASSYMVGTFLNLETGMFWTNRLGNARISCDVTWTGRKP